MQVKCHKNDLQSGGKWAGFLQKTTLSLAVLLLASAFICWIAANWAQASAFQKLAGAQALLAALVLTTWRLVYVSGAAKSQNFSASAHIMGLAAVATGALLALVGQIYQTGADPWQLFLLWAVLLIPWLLTMPTVFVALLGVTLLNLAGALYLGIYDTGLWWGLPFWGVSSGLLALLNLALLVLWEYRVASLDDRWRIGPRVLGAGALAWLVAASVAGLDSSMWSVAVTVAGLLVCALMYRVYTRRRSDLSMVCLAALAAFCLVAALLVSWVDSPQGLLPVIAVLIVLAGLALRHLGGLIRPAAPGPAADQAAASRLQEPWFLSLLRLALMGISASLATVLLFTTLDLRAGQIWLAGGVACAVGLLIFRASRSDIQRELGLTLMAAGLLSAGIGVLLMEGASPAIRAAGLFSAGLVLYVLAASAAWRFLCAFFVLALVLALTWPDEHVYDLLDVVGSSRLDTIFPAYLRLWWLAVAAVLVLVAGPRRPDPAFWAPLGWSLACGAQLMAWLTPAPAWYGWAGRWPAELLMIWLACAALPVLLLGALLWRRHQLSRIVRIGGPVALAVASVGWTGMPGISLALVWLILGYASARRTLLVFGVAALLAYLARFYYQLDSSLLEKSWVLGLTGAWLLLSWHVVRKLARGPAKASSHSATRQPGLARQPWREAGLLAGLALILLVVNTGIYHREQTLAQGQRVVLALAPVDPRSLMQGDYMALRFQVADQLQAALEQAPAALARQIERQQAGYLLLQPDELGVHHVAAVSAEHPGLAQANGLPAPVSLAFRLRGRRAVIVTDAWFFPEGQAARFERARYGDFRVDGKGAGLLTRLLDEQLQPLP